jgi:adenylate cyclase
MATTRRLAAILAADVAGYSRLMGIDEDGTHERLQAHFRQLVHPKIAEHRGRVVKNTGDGLLAEFPSVVDAVRCAAEVQRGMIDREPMVSDERRIRFRIGVNLGDVIAEDGDIFGDGVNVAARLEALAEPGGICVSGTVRDQVRDRLPYALDDMGEQSVKNIARPVRVYALRPEAVADLPARSVRFEVPRRRFPIFVAIAATAVALLVIVVSAWWLWPASRSSPTPTAAAGAPAAVSIAQPLVAPRLSIVVLPFTNLSNDPDQQYFADAVTEDLTTDLSRLAHMLVISRNSAFTYKDKPVNAKQIGRELGVHYVLEGSVQRSGQQVRINAQLIDAETDAHLWAERFDRDSGDLLALQNEITGRIAIDLNLKLIGAQAARPTDNPDTLDYIFRGRAALLKPPSRENYAKAISFFDHALALHPRSVEAQSRLAIALVGRVLDDMTDSATSDINRAEELIGQALAASPDSALTHFAKGFRCASRTGPTKQLSNSRRCSHPIAIRQAHYSSWACARQ